MSDEDPPGGPNPFGGLPFFGDLSKMFQQGGGGGGSWDMARQMAESIARGDESEPNVDPAERVAYEQISRVAELNITQRTGLAVTGTEALIIRPATRHEWVGATINAYRPLLEKLTTALSASSLGVTDDLPVEAGDPSAAFLNQIMGMLGPMMMSMTAGSMVGHLGRKNLGSYDLPLPRRDESELLVVAANIASFTDEWSVPADDMRLWVCLHEFAHHAVLRLPHVQQRLSALLDAYLGAFEPSPDGFQNTFGEIDISNPSSMESFQQAMGDPDALLGVVQSDAQRALQPELNTLVATIVGWVDHVMDTIGGNLIGSYGQLSEALRRRRVTADPSDRFVERLLGLELDVSCYERGLAFASGVVERAGDEGLARLWVSERELPTPNELDAPGLWLARIDLPEDPELSE